MLQNFIILSFVTSFMIRKEVRTAHHVEKGFDANQQSRAIFLDVFDFGGNTSRDPFQGR